jgi:3-phosphoshikimate 1-carboxyvinyltransferase
LTAGLFDTHGDHRLAHAAAVVCLAVPGVELSDIGCTAKTMPDFRALWSAMLDPPAWAGQDGAGREVDR